VTQKADERTPDTGVAPQAVQQNQRRRELPAPFALHDLGCQPTDSSVHGNKVPGDRVRRKRSPEREKAL
jgi:hypothetical protein